ncbi:MAG: hypothetical protein ACKO96_35645, partial [Flammeovirgaceae bacterium]
MMGRFECTRAVNEWYRSGVLREGVLLLGCPFVPASCNNIWKAYDSIWTWWQTTTVSSVGR